MTGIGSRPERRSFRQRVASCLGSLSLAADRPTYKVIYNSIYDMYTFIYTIIYIYIII